MKLKTIFEFNMKQWGLGFVILVGELNALGIVFGPFSLQIGLQRKQMGVFE